MSESSAHCMKLEYRAARKFLNKKTKLAMEIFEKTVYREFKPSFAALKRWNQEFKNGRESLEDDPRSGRPNTALTEENIQ